MFSKKSAEPQRQTPQVKNMAHNSGSTFSVIGADVSIKGDINASADLHVDGTIEGDIKCSSLVQGESSRIMGGVEAQQARLAGHVMGSIKVRELVILRTAQIEGDVQYDALTIEQGAQVEGRFAHSTPSTPAKPATDKGDDKPASPDEPKLSLAG